MPDSAISFRNVAKVFPGRKPTTAIADLSFDIRRGEYVCVVGRTGCGKSTTVNLLLGVEKPTGGTISILGLDPFRQFDGLRGQIGCVFQNDRLLPWRSALDNVRVPIEIIRRPEHELKASPRQLLDRLGLRGFENSYPHELSGGMRQRVALARALVSDPDILLADEAFSHLDEVTGGQLRAEFRQLAKETGKTVLHITHSIDEAITMGDRILVFGRPGRVAADIGLHGDRDGPQREQWRAGIFAKIASADLYAASDPVRDDTARDPGNAAIAG
jgi:NitT/TauT family transport system ATP-binding protein